MARRNEQFFPMYNQNNNREIYPLHELQAARRCLVNILNGSSSVIVKRIKTKCGIDRDNQRIDPSDIFTVPSLMTHLPQKPGTETTTTVTSQTASIDDNKPNSNADNANIKNTPPGSAQTERRGFKRSFTEVDNGNMSPQIILDQDANPLPEGEDVTCYKCDLCECFTLSLRSMKDHLEVEQHYSASRVIASENNGQMKGKAILKPSVIKDENKAFKSIIPVCPVCKSIHKDIFQCAMHHQMQHSRNGTRCYGLAKVLNINFVTFKKNYCRSCKKTFEKPSELHSHWHNEDHYPYILPTNSTRIIAFCVYCDKIFHNVLTCKSHAEMSHLKDDTCSYGIRLLYIADKVTRLNLLPQKSGSLEDQAAEDIKVLKVPAN